MNRAIPPALLLSLGVHLLLAWSLRAQFLEPLPKTKALNSTRSQRLHILSAAEVARLTQKKRPKERAKEPKKPEEKKKGQVVQIQPPKREEVPKESRFLSEYNSKVEREQRSVHHALPSPKVLKSNRRLISPGDDEAGKLKREKKQAKKTKRKSSRSKRSRSASKAKGAGKKKSPKRSRKEQKKIKKGEGVFRRAEQPSKSEGQRAEEQGGLPAPKDYRSLLPSLGPKAILKRIGSVDHVEDVDRGEETFLNTKQYKYAWFFNRVKAGVVQHWNPLQAHRSVDPYGRVYGVRDRMTVVEVTLDARGALKDIYLQRDSGTTHLDDEAIRAFRAAQPFPNPPEGLKGSDGLIRFKFAFYLEIKGAGLRLFRLR